MPPVCEGVTVVDFGSGFAPSVASMILADNGAEVIEVEPPGGDPLRSMPAWRMWNRGKKSVVLDLETGEGRDAARRLAAGADVVIENAITGVMDGLGLGYGDLSTANPGLVYCSITAFGSKGAYKGYPAYDGVVEAKGGGYQSLAGWTGLKGPFFRVRPDASWSAANIAVQSIVGALRVRRLTGKGQHVETSLYQGMTCYDAAAAVATQVQMGIVDDPDALGPSSRGGGTPNHLLLNYMVARTKDGQWMQMTNNTARLFPMWMETIGLSHIFEEEKFKGAPFTFASRDDCLELRRIILAKMQERTLDDWIELFIERGLAGDRFQTTQECMDHPQTKYNGGVIEVDDPEVGRTKQIGPLVRFTETPSVVRGGAPRVGEHNDELLAKAPVSALELATEGSRPTPKRPFDGVTILDFSTWLAAPLGTALLADLGARVIKIESLTGDEFRSRTKGRSKTLHGKESLSIDLRRKEGQEIVHRLVEKADAIMHNMRGDAPKRLGVDYETVLRINPEIIYHYAGSYGSGGPGAGRAAFHPTAGALAGGALWQLGRGNEPPPVDEPMSIEEIDTKSLELFRANEGSPDVSAAVAVGSAMALALFAKERTGKGQYLETTMLTSNSYVASDDFIRYEGKPPRREPDRLLRGLGALQRLYRTADGFISLTCTTQQEWERLCEAIDRPALAVDPRFAAHEGRATHDAQLMAALGLAFKERGADEWESILTSQGVGGVRAEERSAGRFFLTDPAVKENVFIVETNHPTIGRFMRHGPPAHFSLTPSRAGPPHALGEDGPYILSELGFSPAEIEAMRADRLVAWG